MNIQLKDIPNTSGIYKFTNIINRKIYIGSAKNLRKRFVHHISDLKNNSHHSRHFQNAWNKYGEDNFIYEIIELVEIDLLLTREQYYLDTLLFAQEYINKTSKKFIELGYNINPTAKNRLGSIQPEESIRKSVLNNDKVLPVIYYDFNGFKKGEYLTTGDAAKDLNISRCSVYKCCKHFTDYTKIGFFIFKNEETVYSEYFKSLNNDPFVIQPWNKGLKQERIEKPNSIIVFDRYGRFIKTFSYQVDVAKYIKTSSANVSKYKNKKIHKNYLFFDMTFDYESIINKIRSDYYFIYNTSDQENLSKILVFDNFDNFITSYDSVSDASSEMNLNENSIYNVLCGKRKQIKGFKFKYFEDIV